MLNGEVIGDKIDQCSKVDLQPGLATASGVDEDLIRFKMMKMWEHFSSATLGRPSAEERERKKRIREAQMQQIQLELTLDRRSTSKNKIKDRKSQVPDYTVSQDIGSGNDKFYQLHRSRTFRQTGEDCVQIYGCNDESDQEVMLRSKSVNRERNNNRNHKRDYHSSQYDSSHDSSSGYNNYSGSGTGGGNGGSSRSDFVSRLRFLDNSPLREREISPDFQQQTYGLLRPKNRRHTVALDSDVTVIPDPIPSGPKSGTQVASKGILREHRLRFLDQPETEKYDGFGETR